MKIESEHKVSVKILLPSRLTIVGPTSADPGRIEIVAGSRADVEDAIAKIKQFGERVVRASEEGSA